jgi:hypothetical protein
VREIASAAFPSAGAGVWNKLITTSKTPSSFFPLTILKPILAAIMSQPQAPLPQPTPSETARYAKLLHNTALFTAIACPLIAILPPRRLNPLTLGLAGTSVYSTNFLLRESTGRSILQHLSGDRKPVLTHQSTQQSEMQSLPSEAIREQTQDASLRPNELARPGVTEEVKASKDTKDWVAERDQDVQDALDVGKGFGDMIMDQIYEVVNWGKKRDDED